MSDVTTKTILEVSRLTVSFERATGSTTVVNDVSFEVLEGETLGIVGESGCGKTVTVLSILGLLPETGTIDSGKMIFEGSDLAKLSVEEIRKVRGSKIAMIFQDPLSALNPLLPISTQICEVTMLHRGFNRDEARLHAVRMLELVGIPDAEKRIDAYPHEFSGGMRQRIMIAIALSCEPTLLLADEPTTALDVTTQAQILHLIRTLNPKFKTSTVLVTHDLGIVAQMTDRVAVMYGGRILEIAKTSDLFRAPSNPYTKALLKSVPDPSVGRIEDLYQIPGTADFSVATHGCAFAPRCDRSEQSCREELPELEQVSEGHYSRCHFAKEEYLSNQSKH